MTDFDDREQIVYCDKSQIDQYSDSLFHVVMASMGSETNANTISKWSCLKKILPFNHVFIKYQKKFQSSFNYFTAIIFDLELVFFLLLL